MKPGYDNVLLAIGFASPWALLWVLVAAAPIVLHLLSRRRYVEVRWAAMTFLLAAMRKQSRRLRIEQIVLLTVRTLLVLLLVGAIADMFFNRVETIGPETNPQHKNVPTLHLFIIDASYSMANKPTRTTGIEQLAKSIESISSDWQIDTQEAARSRFEQAKQIAMWMAHHNSEKGDAFAVVLMSSAAKTRAVISTPAPDAKKVSEAIAKLEQSHSDADLTQTIAETRRVLAASDSNPIPLKKRKIYFLTDLGRTTWDPAIAGPTGENRAFKKRVEDLSSMPNVSVHVIDLGDVNTSNVAVTDLSITDTRFVLVDQPTTIQTTISRLASGTGEKRLSVVVDLWVDGHHEKEDRHTIHFKAGLENESILVNFEHRFRSTGQRRIEVRIRPAVGDLELDNHRWLVVPVKKRLKALCVGGQPGACFYLTRALRPRSDDEGLIEVTETTQGSFRGGRLDLEEYDCVFFSNVREFPRAQARRIESYLKRGGGVVFFLGNQVSPEAYNRQLTGAAPDGPLVIPATIGPPSTRGIYRFDPRGYAHPIIRSFEGREDAGLLASDVYQFNQMHVPPDKKQTVVLSYLGTGDPPAAAIVADTLHGGRSIVVSTAATFDPSDPLTWTYLPARISFLPIVKECFFWAVRGDLKLRSLNVGDRLQASVVVDATDMKITTTLPDTKTPVVEQRAGFRSVETLWSFAETDHIGIYDVQFDYVDQAGAAVQKSNAFAVNLKTKESDLTKVSELPIGFIRYDQSKAHAEPTESTSPEVSGEVVRRVELSAWLLCGVFTLLVGESLIARLFGHATK